MLARLPVKFIPVVDGVDPPPDNDDDDDDDYDGDDNDDDNDDDDDHLACQGGSSLQAIVCQRTPPRSSQDLEQRQPWLNIGSWRI